jgi:hypothetical protein
MVRSAQRRWPEPLVHICFISTVDKSIMKAYKDIMQIKMVLLAAMIASPVSVLADVPDAALAAYDSSVRRVYARETKSQCLARQRTTTDDIIVCGQIDRKDRYRVTRGGYVLPDIAQIQSPSEKFLAANAMVAAAQSTVGSGYSSSLTGIPRGYLRGSYKLVTRMIAGEDPDAE